MSVISLRLKCAINDLLSRPTVSLARRIKEIDKHDLSLRGGGATHLKV
jgi:hypothetical protein